MKGEEKNKETQADVSGPEFKGYTLEELRYQLALTLVKKEFLKEKALHQTLAIKDQIPLVNGKSPVKVGLPGGLFGKLMRGLDFADYIMLGFQAVKIGKKLGTVLKKRKK